MLIELNVRDIVGYLIEDENLSVEDALSLFAVSVTFEKLNDPRTGLYLEGSAYVYELLKDERNQGALIQTEI